MDKEKDKRPFEEKLAVVDAWIAKIASEGVVDMIDQELLRDVLINFGANFEPKEELQALEKYSNKAKRPGLDAVWGQERVEEYKAWIKDYIASYEARTGKKLPTLVDPETQVSDQTKTAGMMQFFGELTAFAAEKLDSENYRRLTEDRARKGREWQERRGDEPRKPSTPHASFPPGFPRDAWEKIKSFKK